MKNPWFLVALLIALPLRAAALQANTPEAALEEIATADKPEIIARHLPEPVRKRIEELPRPARQQVLQKLLELKSSEFDGCSVRRVAGSGTWEIVDQNGKTQGKVKLADTFISGLDAMLPLEFSGPGGPQMFIVTMRLEGDDWRIADFGPWEKSGPELRRLVHQPSEMERNDAAAKGTLARVQIALRSYAAQHSAYGYPRTLRPLTLTPPHPAQLPANFFPPMLDTAFADAPAIVNGYEFQYLLTMPGDGASSFGAFEITAAPVEYGKTGSIHYLTDDSGVIHCTKEDRPATQDDDDAACSDEE
jgi:hypothetical protein